MVAWLKGRPGIRWALEVVSRPRGRKGWVHLPKRWKVERTLAWLNRCRLLAKETERLIPSSESQVYVASIQRMLRSLHPPARAPAKFCYRA